MKRTFPKTLYIGIEGDKDGEWFIADEKADGLLDSANATRRVAVYELKELADVTSTTTVTTTPVPAKRRR